MKKTLIPLVAFASLSQAYSAQDWFHTSGTESNAHITLTISQARPMLAPKDEFGQPSNSTEPTAFNNWTTPKGSFSEFRSIQTGMRIGNRELLQYFVSLNIIDSIDGWTIKFIDRAIDAKAYTQNQLQNINYYYGAYARSGFYLTKKNTTPIYIGTHLHAFSYTRPTVHGNLSISTTPDNVTKATGNVSEKTSSYLYFYNYDQIQNNNNFFQLYIFASRTADLTPTVDNGQALLYRSKLGKATGSGYAHLGDQIDYYGNTSLIEGSLEFSNTVYQKNNSEIYPEANYNGPS